MGGICEEIFLLLLVFETVLQLRCVIVYYISTQIQRQCQWMLRQSSFNHIPYILYNASGQRERDRETDREREKEREKKKDMELKLNPPGTSKNQSSHHPSQRAIGVSYPSSFIAMISQPKQPHLLVFLDNLQLSQRVCGFVALVAEMDEFKNLAQNWRVPGGIRNWSRYSPEQWKVLHGACCVFHSGPVGSC